MGKYFPDPKFLVGGKVLWRGYQQDINAIIWNGGSWSYQLDWIDTPVEEKELTLVYIDAV
mgnify:CR=1 FL=1